MKNMTIIRMTFSFECVCMIEEEIKEIRPYYRYVGTEFEEREDGSLSRKELYVKKLRSMVKMEKLDLRNFESYPIYICVIQ